MVGVRTVVSSWQNSPEILSGRPAGAPGARSASGKSLKLPTNPKVMFLGDSLTVGIGGDSSGGFRLAVILAFPTMVPFGSQTNASSTTLIGMGKEAHEGHGGFTGPALDTPFAGYLTATGVTIDMVVLHCATNGGANTGGQAPTAASVLSMYSKFMTHNPAGIFLVGCNPGFPCLTTYPGVVTPYVDVYTALNVAFAEIRRVIEILPRAALADVGSTVKDTDLISDGLHPNPSGYSKMAAGWITAISKMT